MHFGGRHSKLLPFCEYVFSPGKSPVEAQLDMLEIILLRKDYIVKVEWWAAVW
jgi:hypothetical protein